MNLYFEQLRKANVRRCEEVFHPLNDWTPTDWATAMAGECGEACNEVKKLRRLDGADTEFDSPENRERLRYAIAAELADLVIYADLLAARLDIDLGAAIIGKFNEVSVKRHSTVKLGLATDNPTLEDVMDWYSLEREESVNLAAWQQRYPQYADDLAEFEALLTISERASDPEISEQEESRLIESATRVVNQVLQGRQS